MHGLNLREVDLVWDSSEQLVFLLRNGILSSARFICRFFFCSSHFLLLLAEGRDSSHVFASWMTRVRSRIYAAMLLGLAGGVEASGCGVVRVQGGMWVGGRCREEGLVGGWMDGWMDGWMGGRVDGW